MSGNTKDRVDYDGMQAMAKGFLTALVPNTEGATVVGLRGDLGSGKTTFTQFIGRELGIKDAITSPTFVIEKIYKLDGQKFDRLIHIDAYRLENTKELESLGWNEIIKDPKNIIMVEWPEKIEEIMPKDVSDIQFKFIDEGIREIDF